MSLQITPEGRERLSHWPRLSDDRAPYSDRREAGRILAERLRHLRTREHLAVLGLARGGSYYEDFGEVSDDEVRELLDSSTLTRRSK
jgi:predicted phosphoribosyltransferase